MERAAILLGVSRSGQLPRLEAVASGVQAVAGWAKRQGFGQVVELTDERGPVAVRDVQDAVVRILDHGPPDQLVVYFAGHGVNVGRSEYWLLSDAPRYTSEAVNAAGSAHLAASCGVPHVVFVSDACRTAAEGLQMQRLEGSDVFPNEDFGAPNQPVDRFYACALGSPSFEVPDPEVAAGRFAAVYTDVLVEDLDGRQAGVLAWEETEGVRVGLVRPRALRDHLADEVGRRLAMRMPSVPLTQNPDAVVTSEPESWLARHENLPRSPRPRGPTVAPQFPVSLPAVARDALQEQLYDRLSGPADVLRAAAGRRVPGAAELLATSELALTVTAPVPSGARSGFAVRGAQVATADSSGGAVTVVGPERSLVRVDLDGGPASVLVQFHDGSGVLLPALDGFVSAVTVTDGEVVDVALEPTVDSPRYADYRERGDELRSLRALALAASRLGTFRPQGEQADELAARIRVAKSLDPTMALLAAYAYHELHRADLIADMGRHLRLDLGVVLFDVALLAGELSERHATTAVAPAIPLLAQGWALLGALRADVRPELTTLREHLLPALWTQFDGDGVEIVRSALTTTARWR